MRFFVCNPRAAGYAIAMLPNICHAAALVVGPSGLPFTGGIRSFSIRGIALAGCREIDPGSVVKIVLKHTLGRFRCQRDAHVTHSRPGRSGSIVSFEFSPPLTNEEFERLHVEKL